MLRYARVAPPGKKCAFVLTRDGRPVKVQRTIFSECFYTMAMNELWKVTGEMHYQVCGCLWGPQAVGHECILMTGQGTCHKSPFVTTMSPQLSPTSYTTKGTLGKQGSISTLCPGRKVLSLLGPSTRE